MVMHGGTKLAALGVATIVNAAALGAVHVAMGNSGGREAMAQPERVVVIARKHDLPAAEALAIQHCADNKAL
jgi:hypothetical protein